MEQPSSNQRSDGDLADDRDGLAVRAWWRQLSLGVLLLIVGGAWALSSPAGSSPDDDFHLGSIWCSSTAPDDQCLASERRFSDENSDLPFTTDGQRPVRVPAQVGPDVLCYIFQPAESARCQEEVEAGGFAETRANDGLYPAGYYTAMGVFVGDEPLDSLLLIRATSWTVSIGLIAAAANVARGSLRSAYILAVLATSVPLGLFLFASTNPSGPAISGVGAFWCAATAFVTADSARDGFRAGIVGVAGIVWAVGARADAAIYVLLAGACAIVLSRGWELSRRRRSVLVGLAALFGFSTVLLSTQAGNAGGLRLEAADRSAADVLWFNVTNLPGLWTGSLGTWGLGWVDTTMPNVVPAGMVAVTGGLLLWGLASADRLTVAATGIASLAVVVAPLAVMNSDRAFVGEDVQPRYLLPMLTVLVAGVLVPAPGRPIRLARSQLIAIGIVVTAVQSVALHANIRRYVTGQDVVGINLDADREWWWTSGPSPMAVWIVGTVAFALVVALALQVCRDVAEDPAASGDSVRHGSAGEVVDDHDEHGCRPEPGEDIAADPRREGGGAHRADAGEQRTAVPRRGVDDLTRGGVLGEDEHGSAGQDQECDRCGDAPDLLTGSPVEDRTEERTEQQRGAERRVDGHREPGLGRAESEAEDEGDGVVEDDLER